MAKGSFLHDVFKMDTGEAARLATIVCCNCGIEFAVPQRWREVRVEDGREFYCPNGHRQVYKSGIHDTLRKEAEELRKKLDFERTEKLRAWNDLAAEKKKTTKLAERVANGVCPCCGRTFKALARHMANKHPEYPAPGVQRAKDGGRSGS